MVVHDEAKKIANKIKKIPRCGYKLIDHFPLPKDAWWIDYYSPLETRINKMHRKYKNDLEALKLFKKDQNEIDMFKKNPKEFGSVFYILQKL